MDKKLAKKLLSLSVHNSLTSILQVCYEAKRIKKQQDPHEKLRLYLAKLFGQYDIVELHNDHLEELAETLQSLYAEKDDLVSYCYSILQYLEVQSAKQNTEKEKWITLAATSSHMKTIDPIEALDIHYQTKVHTDGYYAQHMNMYTLLYDCIYTIMKVEEEKEAANACKK